MTKNELSLFVSDADARKHFFQRLNFEQDVINLKKLTLQNLGCSTSNIELKNLNMKINSIAIREQNLNQPYVIAISSNTRDFNVISFFNATLLHSFCLNEKDLFLNGTVIPAINLVLVHETNFSQFEPNYDSLVISHSLESIRNYVFILNSRINVKEDCNENNEISFDFVDLTHKSLKKLSTFKKKNHVHNKTSTFISTNSPNLREWHDYHIDLLIHIFQFNSALNLSILENWQKSPKILIVNQGNSTFSTLQTNIQQKSQSFSVNDRLKALQTAGSPAPINSYFITSSDKNPYDSFWNELLTNIKVSAFPLSSYKSIFITFQNIYTSYLIQLSVISSTLDEMENFAEKECTSEFNPFSFLHANEVLKSISDTCSFFKPNELIRKDAVSDAELSLPLLRKSYELGLPSSVTANANLAFKYAFKAAEVLKDAESCWDLSVRYRIGLGVSIDEKQSTHFLSLAANAGHIPAIIDLLKLIELKVFPKDYFNSNSAEVDELGLFCAIDQYYSGNIEFLELFKNQEITAQVLLGYNDDSLDVLQSLLHIHHLYGLESLKSSNNWIRYPETLRMFLLHLHYNTKLNLKIARSRYAQKIKISCEAILKNLQFQFEKDLTNETLHIKNFNNFIMVELNQILEAWINNDVHISLDEVEVITELDLLEDESILKSGFEEKKEPAIFTLYRTLKLIYPSEKNLHETCRRLLNSWKKKESNFSDILSSIFSKKNLLKSSEYYSQTLFEELFGILTPIYNNLSDEMLIWNKRNKWARAVYKASDSNSFKEVIQFSDPMKFYEFENKILAAKLLFTETVLPNRILPCIFTGQLENCHIVSENTNVSFASYNKTSKLYKEVSGMYIVIASFPGDNSELSCEIGDQIKVQGCSSLDSNLNPLIAYGENCRSGASINIPFKLLRKTSSDEKNVQNISALPNTSHISVVPALSPSVSMRSSTSKEPVHTSTISEFQPLQSSLSQNVLNGTLKFKLHTKVEKLIKEFAEDFDAPVNFFLLFENHNTVDPIIAATADLVSISKPELNLQKLTEILSMYLETESQFQADINTVLKVKSLGVNFKFLTGEENEKIYFFAEKLAEQDMNFCNKLRNLLKVRTLRCAVVLEKVLLLSLDNLIFWKHFLLFAEILPVAYTHLNILEDLKIDLATNDELKGLRKNLYTLLDRFFCFANVVSLFIEYTTGKKHNCDELVNVANQFFTFLTCLVKQFIAKSDSVKQMNTSATHYFLNSGAELFLERGTLSRAIEKWKDAAFIAKFQKDVINEMMANSNILCAIQEVSDFTLQLSTEWVSLWKKVYQFITSHPKNAFVDTIITSTSHLVENIENLYPNQTSELETSAIIFFLQLTLNVGNAILISKNADDSLSWFFAITNLTTKFLQLGNDLNFSNHYLKCCVLTEVKNLISLASAYENLNQYDNFESTLKKAAFLFNADVSYFLVDSEIERIRASLLSCMGSLYWIRHNNFNAFSCHIMSCQIFKEINDYKNFIYVEGKLGLICIDVGIKILESAYLEGIDIRVFNSVKCITSVLSEGENLLDYCFSDEIFTSGTVYVVKEECIPNVEDDFSIKLSVGDRIVFIEQYEENGIKVGIGLNESNGSQGSFPLSALYDKSKKETSLNLVESLCKENFRSYSKVGMLGWKGSRMIDSKIGNSFIEKGKLLLEAVGLHQDRSFADYDAIALMLSGDSMFNTFFSLNNFEQTVKKSLSLVRSSLDIQDYTSSINLMLQIVENESFKMGKVTVLSSVKVYFVKILTQLLNYEEDIQMYTASLKRILKHIFDYNNPDLEISKKFVSLLIKEFKELSNTNTPYSKIYDYLSLKLLLNSEEQSLISLNEVENEFFKLFCTENSIDYLENASILKIWNHQFSKLVGCTICSEHNFQNYKRFISALPSEELWNNIVNVKCSSVDITQCKHQNMNSMNSIFSLHQPLKKTVVDESLKSFAHSKKSKEINSEKELEASIQKEEILKQIKNLERQLLQLQKKEVLGKEHNLEDIEELPSYVDTM